jgi:hypothetical protein
MGEEDCHVANEKAQIKSAICFSFFLGEGRGIVPHPIFKNTLYGDSHLVPMCF